MGQVQTFNVCRGKSAAEQERSFPNLATLPPEMAQFVLSYLNATDLCLAACVWEQLANDDLLWESLCRSNWGYTSAYYNEVKEFSFKELYLHLDEGRLTFNYDPEKGITYLLAHNVLQDNPCTIARFLTGSKIGLLKSERISDYLRHRRDILEEVVFMQNFQCHSLPSALRQFFKLVSPPTTRGEYLENILHVFSVQYLRCNPNCGLPQETIYIVCYSLILLSVDLYSPQVKRKMSKREFVKNLRGIAVSASSDYIGDLYDDIYTQGHVAKPVNNVYMRPAVFPCERPYGNIFAQA